MSVEFDEKKPVYYNYQPNSDIGGVTNFFIKIGLAKNASSANVVMIIVAIICTGLAIYIAF